jgi:hypothetical protein
MPLPLPRLVLLAYCLLPAVGVSVPAGHTNFVATFMYSCDASDPEPRLRTTYTAAGRPRPRSNTSWVETFPQGQAPARKFVVIGEVSVLASGPRTSVDQLTDCAKRGARRLGGDAIVNVSWDDAAHVQPKAGPVGLKYLTASVVSWEQ